MSGGNTTTGRLDRLRHAYRKGAQGFTIIEVMIVLAVTGALFVSAAAMIVGRQNQTAFDQAIRQVQSQIQQTMNEVSAGYFPDNNTIKCTASGSGITLSSSNVSQGTNSDCIYVGKAIQFAVANTDPQAFQVYTIAGLRNGASGGTESLSLADAKPMVIAPSTSHPSYPDTSVPKELQDGLTAVKMWYNNGTSNINIGAVAFVHSLGQTNSSGVLSGSGQVNVIALGGTGLNSQKLAAAQAMNTDGGQAIINGVVNPSGGVFVCFLSGGTNQYGVVQIGGQNRELSITLQIRDKSAGCS